MFREAREVAVTGSTLINYYWGSENDTDLPTLSKESIKDALHDSRHQELVVNALRPFPDSEGAIPAISHRIFESKNQLCAVWLRDPGSNLAYLCARRLSRQLAASFFFDTKCHSDDTSKFFLTIAYQLALQFRPYDYLLRHKLRRNPDLVDKCLETQFCELIVEPFRQLQFRHVQIGERKLIVVNGIDHCQNPQDRAEILRVIGESRRELPFHWVIFSSPELTAQLEEPAVISVEGLDLCSGSYKGWKMAVAFSRVDEVWTNLPNVGQKYTFISLSIGLTASLFD